MATELGLNPEAFRSYLKKHHPDLFSKYGKTTLDNGKNVLGRSYEKYMPAIEELKKRSYIGT